MLNTLSSWRTRLAVTLAALVAAAGALVVSSTASPARASPTVLRMVSVNVGPGGGGDVLPEGASVGDSDTFTSVLSDPRTGKRVGRGELACTIFDVATPGGHGPPVRDATYHCMGLAYLRAGTLTLSGPVVLDGEGQIHGQPFAILGGTGRYAGAGGWGESTALADGKELTVVHLVR